MFCSSEFMDEVSRFSRFGWEHCWYDRTVAGLIINNYPVTHADHHGPLSWRGGHWVWVLGCVSKCVYVRVHNLRKSPWYSNSNENMFDLEFWQSKYLSILRKSARLLCTCLKYFHWLISWRKWSFNTPTLIFSRLSGCDENSYVRIRGDFIFFFSTFTTRCQISPALTRQTGRTSNNNDH